MKPNLPDRPSAPDMPRAAPKDTAPHMALAPPRSRSLHWVAWGAAVVSFGAAALWRWIDLGATNIRIVQALDVGLAVFFAFEFFTRTGWRRSRTAYVKWRWFDFIAILPITVLGPTAVAAVFWAILVCRAIRLVDRTLGDGFVQRNALALAGAAEEEISDRVLEKMLARWERDLDHANFGHAMAKALERNKTAVLRRVYGEQLQDGTFAKIAHYTGLQAGIEKEEGRLMASLIEMVGSPEVDEALRDVLATTLRRARQRLQTRDWRHRLLAPTNGINGSAAHGTPAEAGVIPMPGARSKPRPVVARIERAKATQGLARAGHARAHA